MEDTLKELFGRLMVRQGDLLATDVPLVMHQANNMGVMGAGVAKQVRADMPDADFMRYRTGVLSDPRGSLGMVYPAHSLTVPDRTYLNVVGQDGLGYGRQFTDYEALGTAFDKIAERYAGQSLAMPYGMGAGLGGGDWTEVERLVNERLAPFMNVFAYKLK